MGRLGEIKKIEDEAQEKIQSIKDGAEARSKQHRIFYLIVEVLLAVCICGYIVMLMLPKP
jgi:uncharacterized membrane protein